MADHRGRVGSRNLLPLCLLYIPFASVTLLMPPLHSLCLFNTPYASSTLLMAAYASYIPLMPPSYSLCHL